MRIRRAYIDDAYAMASLDREIFTIPWSFEAFVSEFSYPGAIYYLALDGDEPVGYAGMREIAGEGHITNVAVREKYRRQGIARSLLEKLFDAGPASFTLEVRRSNLAAISLYKLLGFSPEGVRKGYYADNKEDAVIMWKR